MHFHLIVIINGKGTGFKFISFVRSLWEKSGVFVTKKSSVAEKNEIFQYDFTTI